MIEYEREAAEEVRFLEDWEPDDPEPDIDPDDYPPPKRKDYGYLGYDPEAGW